MTIDITLMGPHALAAYHSRALALESFGIDSNALSVYESTDHSLVKQDPNKQSLVIAEKNNDIIISDESI